jgi:hypothetical protein
MNIAAEIVVVAFAVFLIGVETALRRSKLAARASKHSQASRKRQASQLCWQARTATLLRLTLRELRGDTFFQLQV